MKTIGIIGGFSPQATALFYKELVESCRHVNHGDQPNIIIWNVPLPSKLERAILLHGTHNEHLIPLLQQAALHLQQAGADCVVLPCNTLHTLEHEIIKSIHVPFISILDETTHHLQQMRCRRVGLLGTSLTLESRIFQRRNPTIKFVLPSASGRRLLDHAIHESIKTENNRMLVSVLKKEMTLLGNSGVEEILLACTDFHNLLKPIRKIIIHDTVSVLIKAVTHYCLSYQYISQREVLR